MSTDPESWRTPEYRADWGLEAMRAADAYAAGYTGLGVTVGVVDSGLYSAHPEFADGRVKPLTITGTFGSDGYYFMDGSGAPVDLSPQPSFFSRGQAYTVPGTYDPAFNDPHGTHVSGSIAASRNGVGMHGVAFDANVYVANTHATDESIYGANADYAYFKNAYGSLAAAGARAINSSWGSPPPMDNYNNLPGLRQAYTKFDGRLGYVDAVADVAKQYDIIQVFAAGNTGWDNPNVRSSLPYFRPDIEKNWLAVGAAGRGANGSTAPEDLVLASYSNRAGAAKYWYVAAPGDEINSTAPPYNQGAVWDPNIWGIDPNHQTGYTTVSGTSMAAPHATGALAVIMQRYPYMTNTQARDVLLTTAYHRNAVDGVPDANPNAPNAVWGWGVINLDKAMRGPGQFLGSVAANLPAGVKDTWSNDISEDALIQRKQENDAETAAWATRKAALDSRLQVPVLTAGLPASRTALDGVVGALRNGSSSAIQVAIKAVNDDPVANQVLATFVRSEGYDGVWPLTDPAYAYARTDVGNILNKYLSGLTSADYDRTIAFIVEDWQAESQIAATRIASFAGMPTQGSLIKLGLGTLTLRGVNTFSGGVLLAGGTLSVSRDASLGAASGPLAFDGGTLQITGTAFTSTARPITWGQNGGGLDIADPANTVTLAQALTGSGGLTKLGAGTLALSGTNTYAGPTTLAGGTLLARGGRAIGDLSAVTVAAGATLALADSETVGSLAGQGRIALGSARLTAGGNGTPTTFAGILDGTGGLTKTGSATLTLTGASTYTGDTAIAAGTLSAANAAALGTSVASITTDGTLDVNNVILANTLTLAGTGAGGAGALTGTGTAGVSGAITLAGNAALGGRGTLTVSGPIGDGGNGYGLSKVGIGAAILTGANTYTGATTVWSGTIALAGAGSISAASGLALAAGASFDIAGLTGTGTTIAGLADATGQGGTVTLGAKTLTLADASGSFSGTITGAGGLSLTGGRQILTGHSTYTGATTVADAALEIDGVLAASEVTVRRGGTLSGTGKIGDPLIEAGGRLAPGRAASIGTLAIHGPLTFAPGSFYTVRITPTSNDRTDVTGPVTIQGGAVQVLAGSGTYTPALRYSLLTATGGITGTFTRLQTTSNLAFLTPSLSYETHGIALGFAQTAPLTSVATSPNQARIAGALNGTGPTVTSTPTAAGGAGSTVTTSMSATGTVTTAVSTATGTTTVVSSPAVQVTTALLNQTASGAVRALNSLSGEIQGSAVSVRAQIALAAQGTLLEHLRFGDGLAGGLGLTGSVGQRFEPGTTLPAGYAAFTPDEPATGLVPVRPLAPRTGVWGRSFGVFGSSDATRNTARLTRETGGFLLGAETDPGVLGDGLGSGLDGWRLGVAGGYSVTPFDLASRQSSGRIEGSFGAAYVNGTLGPVHARFGALYGRDALDTRRTVLFPGFSQTVSGRAGGGTLQGFGEVGYRIGEVEHFVEPFVGVAALRLRRDGFTETGGSAALTAFGRTDPIETITAGLQAQAVVADLFGGAGPLLAQGLIGYRKAFGNVAPAALLAFRGSTAFRTAGAPLAPDAALASAGLDWAVAPGTVVGLSYDGQIGARTRDHALKGSLSYRW